MKGYGREFGLRCEKEIFQDTESAIRYVNEKTAQGIPVLISFYTGPNMVNAPFSLQIFSSSGNRGPLQGLLDSRLWIPRQIGERQSGGHSVVAVASFAQGRHTAFLMLDSDWSEPRVWDASAYLGGKADLKNLEFYSCDSAE